MKKALGYKEDLLTLNIYVTKMSPWKVSWKERGGKKSRGRYLVSQSGQKKAGWFLTSLVPPLLGEAQIALCWFQTHGPNDAGPSSVLIGHWAFSSSPKLTHTFSVSTIHQCTGYTVWQQKGARRQISWIDIWKSFLSRKIENKIKENLFFAHLPLWFSFQYMTTIYTGHFSYLLWKSICILVVLFLRKLQPIW